MLRNPRKSGPSSFKLIWKCIIFRSAYTVSWREADWKDPIRIPQPWGHVNRTSPELWSHVGNVFAAETHAHLIVPERLHVQSDGAFSFLSSWQDSQWGFTTYFCDQKPRSQVLPTADFPVCSPCLGAYRSWGKCEQQPQKADGTGRNCSRADEAGDKRALNAYLSVFLLIESRAEAGISTVFYCWEKLSQGPAGSYPLKTGEKSKRKNKLKKEDMSKIKIVHGAFWEILLSKPHF